MKKKISFLQLSILATLSGSLTVVGFAPFNLFFVPILTIALFGFTLEQSQSYRQAMGLGLMYGLGLFGTGISWIYISLTKYGGMGSGLAISVVLLFSIYLSAYLAITGGLVFYFRKLSSTLRILIIFPAAWTLSEIGRAYVFTGFPWLSIGYSQVPNGPLIGFGPILGVFGVSFLTIFLAACLLLIVTKYSESESGKSQKKIAWTLMLLLMLGQVLASIEWSLPTSHPPTKVALIQGNVSQLTKWDPSTVQKTLTHYKKLVDQTSADLVLLPETAFPIFNKNIPNEFLESIVAPVKERKGDLLVGIPEIGNDGKYYNSVFSFGKSPKQIYRKKHLVPFGDYFPLQSVFYWFISNISMPMSSFSSGDNNQSTINAGHQKIGINICYEDVFGRDIIGHLPDATILANFTNDAWWGRSLAAQQHLQISQMRAIETARVMLRATNTGATAIIDWKGKILKVAPEFETTVIEGTATGREGTTPFSVLGNKTILVFSIVIMGFGLYLRQKNTRKQSSYY